MIEKRNEIIDLLRRYMVSLGKMDSLIKAEAWKVSLLEELSSFLKEGNTLYSHLEKNFPYRANVTPAVYDESKKEEYKEILQAVIESITDTTK